jgi:hypothetical protein
MELIVGALVVMMDDDGSDREMRRRSDLDEALAARCAAL